MSYAKEQILNVKPDPGTVAHRYISRNLCMMIFTIDLTTVHSYYDLHEHLKKVFSFPEWYGRNMDALWDLLHCSFDEPTTIEVKGIDSVRKDLKDVVGRFQLVVSDLRDEDGITISYL